MSSNSSERIRAKNFESKEISLLVELVQKNRKILESKQSGAVSNKQKDSAWESLTKQFNAKSGTFPRSSKNLKEKWANLKKTAVRNFAADKKYRGGTGGGPRKPPAETPVEAVINDILGERLTGMAATCDSDAIEIENPPWLCNKQDICDNSDAIQVNSQQQEWHESLVLEEMNVGNGADIGIIGSSIVVTPMEGSYLVSSEISTPVTPSPVLKNSDNNVSESTTSNADWTDYTPAMLKKPPSRLLQVNKKGKQRIGGSITNAKWCDLADTKKVTALLKEKNLMEENERKKEIDDIIKKQLVEEHQQKMRHREEEHQLKLKLLKEEHEAKLKKLLV